MIAHSGCVLVSCWRSVFAIVPQSRKAAAAVDYIDVHWHPDPDPLEDPNGYDKGRGLHDRIGFTPLRAPARPYTIV